MTDKHGLLELAERCERAKGPSRDLDYMIAMAIDWHPAGVDARLMQVASSLYLSDCPLFTWHLNAAKTLVPEGSTVGLSVGPDKNSAFVVPLGADLLGPARLDSNAQASTPELALCAAALRACAAQGTPTRRAETTGSVGEADGGPVVASGDDAPIPSSGVVEEG